MNKKYWFYIDTYVHISLKKGHLLLYNPLNCQALEYWDREEINRLVKRLSAGDNLWVIPLRADQLQHGEIADFVNDVRRYFMGDLLDAAAIGKRPVQMMPLINIQADAQHIKKQSNRSIGENTQEYLTELSLFLNSSCSLDCDLCSTAYKQFHCCTRHLEKGELAAAQIAETLTALKGSLLEILHLNGANIATYSQWETLLPLLGQLGCRKIFYLHYLNLIAQPETIDRFNIPKALLNLLVTFPSQVSQLEQALSLCNEKKIDVEWVFVIRSEAEFALVEKWVTALGIEHYSFRPFYDGQNLEFFRENIFIVKSALFEAATGKKERDARQSLNTLDFGTLTMASNGDVYGNLNTSPLGNINEAPIYQLIQKEMEDGYNWRRVRRKVEPCKSCVFDALCPPLSNYEYAIGQNNLCRIREETI
jgi:pseudo-rSAM protein